MMKFDLFVVGGGSGGVRAARVASSLGLKTGLAERWSLGGTCVNRGCIPKKLYSYASVFSEEVEIMKAFGWTSEKNKFNWNKLRGSKVKELKRLNEVYFNLLKKSNVKIFPFNAEFIDNKTLKINKNIVQAKNILISVGTKPRNLNLCKEKKLISSDEAFDLKKLPRKILILGGGYIAVEFASIFNGLGVDTTLCIRGERILKEFDPEISGFLMDQMQLRGVKFLIHDFPTKIHFKNNKFKVCFSKKTKSYEQVMEATGRVPNLDKLKINNTQVILNENKSIIVNDFFQTSVKNIYAIGDVINRVQLTPVAISEAMIFVKNLKSKKKMKCNYKNIPTAVFANPNYACVGYNEIDAKKKFGEILVFKSNFRSLKYSITKLKEKVFIKLIVDKSNDRVLGLHYIGENAAEIIQGFAVAIVNGLTKKQFDKTIGIHPTCAEEIVTLK
ncbi:MAG: glutathione-disulfide reductase [Alphaproteobacteria bacterium]